MSDGQTSRMVECQDCGYRWESAASSPRCSKPDCGRSRNVEPVDDEVDGEADPEPEDDLDADEDEGGNAGRGASDGRSRETNPGDLDDEDGSDETEGFTPAFESVENTAENVDPSPSTPTSTATADDDEHDADQDDDDEDEPKSDPLDDVPEIDPDQLAVAFDVTFEMVGSRRGEHWTLDDDEPEQLGKAWAPVMNTYAPRLFAEHTEVGVAVLCTFSILAPKLAEDRRLAELAEQAEREAENGTPGEVREPDTDASTAWTAPDEQDDEQDADATAWVDDSPDAAAATVGGYENI